MEPRRSPKSLTRRRLLYALSGALVTLAGACAPQASSGPTPAPQPAATQPPAPTAAPQPTAAAKPTTAPAVSAPQKVTFILDTTIIPKHGLFMPALYKGYYKEVGLEVDIVKSGGSGVAAETVAAGKAELGFGDIGAMMLARAKGARVKYVGAIHALSPFAVVTLAKTGIRQPKDLEGRTVGTFTGTSLASSVELFASITKIDASKVKQEILSSDVRIPSLIAGKVDALMDFYVSVPPVIEAEGIPTHSLKWSDYGWQAYANGLLLSDDTIAKNPDLGRRLVQATMRGVQYANDHPDEAAEMIVRFNPDIKPKAAEVGVRAAAELLWTPEAKEYGLGYVTLEGVQNVRDLLIKHLNQTQLSSLDPKEVFDMSFLELKKSPSTAY